MCIYIYIYIDTHTFIYMYTHTCTHTRTHTHIYTSMTSVERQLQDMGGESTSKATANLLTYFWCAVPDQIEIHPLLLYVSKG